MSDYKPHVVIDDQKNIILPEELKNHMVQLDHNVKTITFDCPRYSDGRDLSTMRIYVNYFRKSGEKDSDVCQNIKVDSKDTNLIHFEWVPKRSATLEAGVLAFLICAEKEDAEGNQENACHTKLCKDLKIAEGIDCLKAVIEKYPTIITYLLTRMEDVESIATPEAMQAYVNQYLLENPPSGMTEEERALLEENIALTRQIQTDLATVDQSKADAIICTAEGSTIVATDSAEAGFEGLHLYGRSEQVTTTGAQLLDMSEAVGGTDAGITVTVNDDGSYTMSGTATAETANVWLLGYYGSTTTLFTLPAGTYYLKDVRLYNGSTAIGPSTNGSFTLNSDTNITGARCVGGLTIGTTYNTTKYPMINSGIEALSWEPYTGGKPSPSVEYPQEIVSAGKDGSVEVKSGQYNFSEITRGLTMADGTVDDDILSQPDRITTKDFETVSAGTYVLECSGVTQGIVVVFDMSGNVLTSESYADQWYTLPLEFEIKEDRKIKFTLQTASNNPDTYKPVMYKKEQPLQTLTSLTPNGLPGIKVTDASLATYTDENGQMWCADEIDFERGVYVQRIIRTILPPDLVWKKSGEVRVDRYFTGSYQIFGGNKINPTTKPIITHFDRSLDGAILNGVEISRDGGVGFSFAEAGTSTVDDFVEFLTNNTVTAMAILATPIETPLSDEELAAYKALHTNKPTTTIMNSENVHMKVDYVADTKNHIKQNYVPLSEYTALEERVAAIEELVIS